jgi:hypothetical protein
MTCSVCEQEKEIEELKELFGFKICNDCVEKCSNILMTTLCASTVKDGNK